jgi:aldo/keto reductase family protein
MRVLTSRSRRRALCALAAAASSPLWPQSVLAQGRAPLMRGVPSTGEMLPVIGVGSWITFNVPPNTAAAAGLVPVLRTFFERGGAMIDSSPMYGYSETIIGEMLAQVPHPRLFSATKIWTVGKALGRLQFERSLKFWRVSKLDLVHVHNMLDWENHLETLKELKAAPCAISASRRRKARTTSRWKKLSSASASTSCNSRTTSPIGASRNACFRSRPSGRSPW